MTADLIMRVNVRTTTTTTATPIIRVRGVCELRMVRAMYGMVEQRFVLCARKGCCNDCSDGIRSTEEYESASFYGRYMTLCPWLIFGRKLKGYGP